MYTRIDKFTNLIFSKSYEKFFLYIFLSSICFCLLPIIHAYLVRN